MTDKFGKYVLERKLAVGGMAEIFLASHSGPEGFKKHLAIKRILPYLNDDSDFVTMFLDEARLVARFSHPNIVQIFELGKVDGSYFLAMEFVNGVSVSRLMKACRKKTLTMPVEYAVKVVSYACDGLEYAHSFTDPNGTPLNLIHRDVSPQNLMQSYDGVVKVLDFGIAKAAINSYQTRTSSLKGKAAYMSPEQILQKGGLDRRSDVFSLGIVLYELTTGHRPFRGDTELELMMSIVKKPAMDPRTFNETIPVEIVRILAKALEKNRQKRYQTALQMRQELEEFLLNRRILVDNHTLGSFAREILPPGDLGVGSSNLTPSAPSFVEVSIAETGSVIPPRISTSKSAGDEQQDFPTQHTPSSQPRPVLESASIPIDMDKSFSPMVRDGENFDGPERKTGFGWKKMLVIVFLVIVTIAGAVFLVSGGNPKMVEKSTQSSQALFAGSPSKKEQLVQNSLEQVPTVTKTKTENKHGEAAVKGSTLGKSSKTQPVEPHKKKHFARRKRKIRKKGKSRYSKTIATASKNKEAPIRNSGSLFVDSRPWTNITIDGMSYGATPLGPIQLKAGIHKLVLSNRSKGIVLIKKIHVLSGQTQHVREKFGQGYVLIFVKPFGEVLVDGVSKGMTPLDKPISLYEGTHKLSVVCPKTGKKATRTVRLNAGDTLRFKFDLR